MSSLNPPGTALHHSHMLYHWVPGIRDQVITIFPPQEVTPQSPFLQTRQAWSPQPQLTGHALQCCQQPCSLLWKCSRTFTSFFSCGAQNCTQHWRGAPDTERSSPLLSGSYRGGTGQSIHSSSTGCLNITTSHGQAKGCPRWEK